MNATRGLFPGNIIEKGIHVGLRGNVNAVYRGYDSLRDKTGGGLVKGAVNDNLIHFQAIARIRHIIKQTEGSGAVGTGCRRGAITSAGVRHVQLTEEFAKEFGKIIVVVDMGEEAAIGGGHGRPVDTVHVLFVETCSFLYRNIIEHGFTFGCEIHLLLCSG